MVDFILALLSTAGLMVVLFGNINLKRRQARMDVGSDEIDEQGKKDIYNVLWQKDISDWPEKLPQELNKEKLTAIGPKHFGQETFTMLQDVKTKMIPLVQRTPERYDKVSEIAQDGFSARKMYALGEAMGLDYFNGYAAMNSIKALEFPRDYGMHIDFQFGWIFIVANLKDQKGNDVDLLITYFRRTIYPPDIAEKMGLSEIDNQVIEQVIGLGFSDKNIHIQGGNPAISGKTGLIELGSDPFLLKLGKNEVKSVKESSLFPLSIKIYDPEKDIAVDLTLEQTKPLFLEGDEGKAPSMYGLGTWYYSIPNLKTSGTIGYAGDVREVNGKGWFDNQWTAGVMPTGYPGNLYVRALSNILNKLKNEPPFSWGWDWMEVQFDNDVEVTLSAIHSTKSEDLKNKGENPPEVSKNTGTGKIINPDGKAENITATVTIDKWFKSASSSSWYPDRWKVEIPDRNISFVMTPTSPNQIFHTAGGSEFREGGVKATGTMGDQEINGYGFGEGTAYAGEDYYLKTKFKILGFDDTKENRKLFMQQVPGVWLAIQSIILYLVSLLVVGWALSYLYRLIF